MAAGERDGHNLSKGFTFVKFTSKHDAEKAILKFNGKQFDNRTLAIDRALSKKIYTVLIGIGRGYVEDVRDSTQVLYEEARH
ncbi:hypothetical protein Dimus_019990 [Dionaea muscipula]